MPTTGSNQLCTEDTKKQSKVIICINNLNDKDKYDLIDSSDPWYNHLFNAISGLCGNKLCDFFCTVYLDIKFKGLIKLAALHINPLRVVCSRAHLSGVPL